MVITESHGRICFKNTKYQLVEWILPELIKNRQKSDRQKTIADFFKNFDLIWSTQGAAYIDLLQKKLIIIK